MEILQEEGKPAEEVKPVEAQEPDILKKVTSFMEEAKPTDPPVDPDFKFDPNTVDLDKLPPEVKQFVEDKTKSLEKGYQQKFQSLAEMRKEMEELKSQVNQPQGWTPERVQQLVGDPEFVKAAQQVAGTDDEYSNLSDQEKAEIHKMKAEMANLKQSSMNAMKQAQDAELAQKYSNYNPQAIDTLTADLISNKRQATREDLYWAAFGKENAVNAYKMGVKDGQSGVPERVASSSVEGNQVASTPEQITQEDGESSKSFFRRINQQVLSKIKK